MSQTVARCIRSFRYKNRNGSIVRVVATERRNNGRKDTVMRISIIMSPHLPDLLLSVSIGNLTVIVLAGLIVRYIKRCYFTALFDIPGPFAASVTRGWRVKEVYYGRVEKTELELHELPGMNPDCY